MKLSRIYLEKGGGKCHKEERDRLFGIILLTKLLMAWGDISYTTRLTLGSRALRANNYISDILGPKFLGRTQHTADTAVLPQENEDCTLLGAVWNDSDPR